MTQKQLASVLAETLNTDQGTAQKCHKCGYQWRSRVEYPKSCPRCKTRMDAPKRS